MAAVPARVRACADDARLGALRAVDRGPSPVRRAVGTGVAVAVAIALAIGLSVVQQRGGPGALRYVGLLALFLAFVPFGRALRDVVIGASVTCVHERGLVLGTNRAATALVWRRTRRVTRLRSDAALLGWDVLGKDDRTYRVWLRGTPADRAALATALEDTAHRAGVAITEQE